MAVAMWRAGVSRTSVSLVAASLMALLVHTGLGPRPADAAWIFAQAAALVWVVRRLERAEPAGREGHTAVLPSPPSAAPASAHSTAAAGRSTPRFLAALTHEIRTPMNGVAGIAALLMDTKLTPEQEAYVSTITSSSQAVLAIVNDILDMSKADSGTMKIVPVDFSLDRELREIIALLEPSARAKGTELSYQVHGRVPDALRGDAGRIRQVLINLLGNAIKFTERGRVRIDVHPTREVDANVELTFAISDTGIGIPEAAQREIFLSFAQVEGQDHQKYGGTGLGLAITKRIVDLMNGSVDLESEVGHGTTFRVTLPLEVRTGAALRASNAAPQAPLGLRVLVADDNAVNRKVACKLLERWSCTVDAVEHGAAAVDAALRERYDLVLMDCQMPELDGYEATRAIREAERSRGHRTVIIALTAHADDGNRATSLAAGMDDHLTKPFRADEVHEVLRRWARPAAATSLAPPAAQPSLSTPR